MARKNLGRVRGLSAFEVAQKYGSYSSEQEWLASLKGEKGDRGEQGIKGDKGDKGDTGANGDGSNVNLDDYYTKSEVDEKVAGAGGSGSAKKTYEKFVVICVAGQSNAVGYDESPLTEADVSADPNRIFELVGSTKETATLEPLGHCAHNMQDMRTVNLNNSSEGGQNGRRDGTKGIHLPLCNLLLNYIPDDYGIIMIPVAYGATKVVASNSGNASTFWASNSQNWGANSNYSYIVQNRIKHCLDLNEHNLFAGIVWCQGEHNISDLASLQTGFPAMVTQINNALQGYKNRTVKGRIDEGNWFIYESTPWYMNSQGGRNIWNFYKEWLASKTMHSYSNNFYTSEVKTCVGNYVELPDWTPMNPYNAGTSSQPPAHFGQNAFRIVIAPRVARAMLNAGVLPTNEFDSAGSSVEAYDDSELTNKIQNLESSNSSLRSHVEQLQTLVVQLAEKVGDGDIEVPEIPAEKTWKVLTADKMTKLYNTNSTATDGAISVQEKQAVILDADVTKIRATAGAINGSYRLLGMGLIQRGEDGTGTSDWAIDVAFTFFNGNAVPKIHKWSSSSQTLADTSGSNVYTPDNWQVSNYNKIVELLGQNSDVNVEFEMEKTSETSIRITKYSNNYTTVVGSPLDLDLSAWEGITAGGRIRFAFTGYGANASGMHVTNIQYYA